MSFRERLYTFILVLVISFSSFTRVSELLLKGKHVFLSGINAVIPLFYQQGRLHPLDGVLIILI